DSSQLSIFAARLGETALDFFKKIPRFNQKYEIEDVSEACDPWKETVREASQIRGDSEDTVKAIIDFLDPIFQFEKRISPAKALTHPYFQKEIKIHLEILNPPVCEFQSIEESLQRH